jgi:hypothetical protein
MCFGEKDVFEPTNMVIVLLVTKPLFLMLVLLILFMRHHVSSKKRQDKTNPRLLHEESPVKLLEQ